MSPACTWPPEALRIIESPASSLLLPLLSLYIASGSAGRILDARNALGQNELAGAGVGHLKGQGGGRLAAGRYMNEPVAVCDPFGAYTHEAIDASARAWHGLQINQQDPGEDERDHDNEDHHDHHDEHDGPRGDPSWRWGWRIRIGIGRRVLAGRILICRRRSMIWTGIWWMHALQSQFKHIISFDIGARKNGNLFIHR